MSDERVSSAPAVTARGRAGGLAFGLVLAGVVVAHALLVAPGLHETRLWEDEGYNLSVPLNLVHGHGYASDGLLAGVAERVPFDVRISTGPTVLLPVAAALATGIDPALGARLVMAGFFAALLVGLWLLGRRIAGRWGGLVAVAVPLALHTNVGVSAIQGPTDLLGELPAAAFLVFALLLHRRHPLWCGILLGLAVLTKTLALLAVPVVAAMLLLAVPGLPRRARLARLAWGALGGALPLAAWELVKLLSLGPAASVANLRAFVCFFRTGGQVGFDVSPLDKLWSLVTVWTLPGGLVVALVVLAAAVLAAAARASRPSLRRRLADDRGRDILVLLAGSAAGLLVWSAWWIASVHTPLWVRYAVTALVAFVPPLAAAVVLAVRVLRRQRGPRWMPVVAGASAAVLAGGLAVQAVAGLATPAPAWPGTLDEQRRAAEAIGEAGIGRLHVPWGPAVAVAVLSPAQAVGVPAPDTALLLAWYDRSAAGRAELEKRVRAQCAEVLVRSGPYVACVPEAAAGDP